MAKFVPCDWVFEEWAVGSGTGDVNGHGTRVWRLPRGGVELCVNERRKRMSERSEQTVWIGDLNDAADCDQLGGVICDAATEAAALTLDRIHDDGEPVSLSANDLTRKQPSQ